MSLPLRYSFTDLIALAALLLWPAIPLFWMPVHCVPSFFRRLGRGTYILPFITGLPLALITFRFRDFLLSYRLELPVIMNFGGVVLFVLGAGIQVWTLLLLTLPVIMGMPEVIRSEPTRLVTTGPYTVVRHPTYLSHSLMLIGLFFVTGITAVGIMTLIDIGIVNIIVIPLEEKELRHRFGSAYEEYCKKVPSRFLPLRRHR